MSTNEWKFHDFRSLLGPEPPHTHAKCAEGRILCDTCEKMADTIHLIPDFVELDHIEAACYEHDPGGYWFRVEDFPWFIYHLAGKVGTERDGDGPSHAVADLLRWLPYGYGLPSNGTSKTKRKPIPVTIRFAVFARDAFRCRYCGRRGDQGVTLHLDHVKSVRDGGTDSIDNLVTACRECNLGKGAKSLGGREDG